MFRIQWRQEPIPPWNSISVGPSPCVRIERRQLVILVAPIPPVPKLFAWPQASGMLVLIRDPNVWSGRNCIVAWPVSSGRMCAALGTELRDPKETG